jgi:hypothetical protein
MRRVGSAILVALVILVLPSCSKAIRRVPVRGTVTLDGKPFSVGVVMYHPDTDKGNNHRIACLGPAKSGEYNLVTTAIRNYDNGVGVPTGWYKVTWFIDDPDSVKVKIHPKFMDANKSPIAVEVVDDPAPGAYDIAFTSK